MKNSNNTDKTSENAKKELHISDITKSTYCFNAIKRN